MTPTPLPAAVPVAHPPSRSLRPLWLLLGVGVGFGLALLLSTSLARAAGQHAHGVTLCAGKHRSVSYAKHGRCPKHTRTLALGSEHDVAKLKTKVHTLSKQVATLRSTLTGVTRTRSHGISTLTFSGENVQIVNGTGDETTVDGMGNLIIGYNNNPDGLDRTGSHNLIVGDDNGYSSYGGIVAGYGDLISGRYASTSGGFGNSASGDYASVSGGTDNNAQGKWATVIGGDNNTALGVESSVTGGILNTAQGSGSSILGGYNGTVATNDCSSIPANDNTSAECT